MNFCNLLILRLVLLKISQGKPFKRYDSSLNLIRQKIQYLLQVIVVVINYQESRIRKNVLTSALWGTTTCVRLHFLFNSMQWLYLNETSIFTIIIVIRTALNSFWLNITSNTNGHRKNNALYILDTKYFGHSSYWIMSTYFQPFPRWRNSASVWLSLVDVCWIGRCTF